ncbi:DUF2786 domain-containing protein [Rhodococcus sp. ARC_M12]|uniref:DUF2786 domain-containing protein n=1 Tax=Rhodococcus sp. ARC_M12 TaxID=2928854 RepID=UPI001FB397F9|nr:DUF2786 domain-containing protein [Rhodococcus sp. ARC_M12]MCJ0978619.1 DUF2786 domain-containing protein [Rhodococcus sp. ARC_M12]
MSRIDSGSIFKYTHATNKRESADPHELLDSGIGFAQLGSSAKDMTQLIAERLSAADETDPACSVHDRAATILDGALDTAFENGWQPAELVHVTRQCAGGDGTVVMVEAIAAHAERSSAERLAPDSWRDQLSELHIDHAGGTTAQRLRRWRSYNRRSSAQSWYTLLLVLGCATWLLPLEKLLPPPARWTSQSVATGPGPATDTKMLGRIRGLLAKAESTQFPAEAEALSAKAQDLMTRYAIDSALLDSEHPRSLIDDVVTRRIMVSNPYSKAKLLLLHCVCHANGARTLWKKKYLLATVMGLPVDLDLCELLYTSLLVQSARALDEVADSPAARTRSFRHAFLIAYAHRVGERLHEARKRATAAATQRHGSALVPIMAERSDAVDRAYAARCPSTKTITFGSGNAEGSYAGRAAAERADLTGGRERIDKSDLAS